MQDGKTAGPATVCRPTPQSCDLASCFVCPPFACLLLCFCPFPSSFLDPP